MPWIIGLAVAGGSLLASGVGDAVSANAQSGANATNLQIANNQMAFQQKTMNQAEAYNTNMADTAVQRRSQDLAAAGLNPSLAAGSPASSPTISSAQGASATMQNPDASFGNLGNQTATAAQAGQNVASAQAAIDLQQAQATNTRAQAATTLAQLPSAGATAAQQLSNLQEQQGVLRAAADNAFQQFNITENMNPQKMQQLLQDTDFQKTIQPIQEQLESINLQRAKLGMPELQNDSSFANTWLGKYLAPLFKTGLGTPVNSALKSALP